MKGRGLLVFNDLVVQYLFLGGAGGGACLILSVMGLLVPKECITAIRSTGLSQEHATRPVVTTSFAYRQFFIPLYGAAIIALSLGIICLVLDLGRFDRLLLLLTRPFPTFITFGSYALFATLLLSLLLFAGWAGFLKRLKHAVFVAMQVALAASSSVVIWYTGALLQSLKAVPVWNTPLLVALFILSALSCGAALCTISTYLSGSDQFFRSVTHVVVVMDVLLIIVELAVVFLFLLNVMRASQGSTMTAVALAMSGKDIMFGSLSPLFWLGFVLIGLVLPLLIQVFVALRRMGHHKAKIIASTCVLFGGFLLRYCVVQAGLHPVLGFGG